MRLRILLHDSAKCNLVFKHKCKMERALQTASRIQLSQSFSIISCKVWMKHELNLSTSVPHFVHIMSVQYVAKPTFSYLVEFGWITWWVCQPVRYLSLLPSCAVLSTYRYWHLAQYLRQTFGISPISFGKLIGIKFVRRGLNSGPIAIPQTMPVSVWRWNKVGKENSVN